MATGPRLGSPSGLSPLFEIPRSNLALLLALMIHGGGRLGWDGG